MNIKRKNECLETAKKYTVISQWANSNWKDYMFAKRNNFFNECIVHMVQPMRWTKESVLKSTNGYEYLSDWRKDFSGAYDYATANQILPIIKEKLKSKKLPNRYWTLERCLQEAIKYKTIQEWRSSSGASYSIAKSKKWIDQCAEKMIRGRIKWTLEKCLQKAAAYKTRIEWVTKCNGSYQAAIRNSWLEMCTLHMETETGKWSLEDLQKELGVIFGDEIQVDVKTYNQMRSKCTFIDKEYGPYIAKPSQVIHHNKMHPARLANTSRGEQAIGVYVQSLGITILNNYRLSLDGTQIEIDVFLPNLKIGIEYNGLYWHSTLNKPDVNYHFKKRELCEKCGIRLIQIQEDEWRDKQDIVKSMIKNVIHQSDRKIMARKTSIREVSVKEAQIFYEKNHLMGSIRCKNVGLYEKDELVSLMGYKKHKDGIDISRFCNKINTSVAGGLSRLIKEVERRECPKFIQYFIDLRYGTGVAIRSIGFTLQSISLGWKWTDKKITLNRRKIRANMDERKLSEKEYAEEFKVSKIYDAGQAKYVFTIARSNMPV